MFKASGNIVCVYCMLFRLNPGVRGEHPSASFQGHLPYNQPHAFERQETKSSYKAVRNSSLRCCSEKLDKNELRAADWRFSLELYVSKIGLR